LHKTKEKDELLNETKEIYKGERELVLKDLIITYLVIFIVLALFFPKIYIASNIYFESVKINALRKKIDILQEENKLISQKLEYQKFIENKGD